MPLNKCIITNAPYEKIKISLIQRQAIFIMNDKKIIAVIFVLFYF
jgi:hypothetical protein